MGGGVWECDQVPASKSKVSTQIGGAGVRCRLLFCEGKCMPSLFHAFNFDEQDGKKAGLFPGLLLIFQYVPRLAVQKVTDAA